MIYSDYQWKKAKKILSNNGIAVIEDNLIQVRSGTEDGKSYLISNRECECEGYKFNKQCTHVLAYDLWRTKNE